MDRDLRNLTGKRGSKRAKCGAGGGFGGGFGAGSKQVILGVFWLTGVGIWGNLRVDYATVSSRTEVVSRPRGPGRKGRLTGLVGILTGVLVARIMGKCT